MSEEKLTGKQQAFINAYLGASNFNATEAARIAGYKGDDVTLAAVGYENLRKPQIAVEVQGRFNEAAMSANEVLKRLSKHARGSLADVLDDDGRFNLKLARENGVDDLLKRLKVRTTTRRTKDNEEIEDVSYEYEIHDAQAALVHLGKFHRIFADRQEITGLDGVPFEVVVKHVTGATEAAD